MNKHHEYRRQYEKDQQTIKPFDKLYRKSLQDNVLDKNDMKIYIIFLLKILMKQKMSIFYKHEYKI